MPHFHKVFAVFCVLTYRSLAGLVSSGLLLGGRGGMPEFELSMNCLQTGRVSGENQ